jgi:hypothetical protein
MIVMAGSNGGCKAVPCDDSVTEPYTGDDFPQIGVSHRCAAAAHLQLHQKIDRSYKLEGTTA